MGNLLCLLKIKGVYIVLFMCMYAEECVYVDMCVCVSLCVYECMCVHICVCVFVYVCVQCKTFPGSEFRC